MDEQPTAALTTTATSHGASPRRGSAGDGAIPRMLIASAVGLALVVWVLSPRFGVHFPSMIDDWFAIDNGPSAMHHLLRLDYVPAEVNDPRRYRPAYTAVWTYLQWHTLGAPGGLTGPNIWNIGRVGLLCLSLAWLVFAAAPRTARTSRSLPMLALVPVLLVLGMPAFGIDFARFGPVEPILVGAMVAGGLLLLTGLARWLRHRRWTSVVPAIAVGYVLWLLGVYQKEASVCFLVLLPFLIIDLNKRWREDGTVQGPLWRQRPALAVGAAMVLPVVHVLFEVKRIAASGETVYGAPIPAKGSGLVGLIRDAFHEQWTQMPSLLHSRLPIALALGTTLAVVTVGVSRRRVPWIELGLTVTAWSVLVFQGLSGALATRYYIPEYALFGVALALALLGAPALIRGSMLAATVALAVGNIPDTHRGVSGWAQTERKQAASVFAAARLNPAKCPVYMASMIAEYADALPSLAARVDGTTTHACDKRFAAMLVYGRTAQVTPVTNETVLSICRHPGWIDLKQTELFEIFGCARIKRRPIAGQRPQAVLAQDRLTPGVRYSDRIAKGGQPQGSP
jgi:hypothetical protein